MLSTNLSCSCCHCECFSYCHHECFHMLPMPPPLPHTVASANTTAIFIACSLVAITTCLLCLKFIISLLRSLHYKLAHDTTTCCHFCFLPLEISFHVLLKHQLSLLAEWQWQLTMLLPAYCNCHCPCTCAYSSPPVAITSGYVFAAWLIVA